MAEVRNGEQTWADKQNKLKKEYKQTRSIEDLDERKKKQREIEEKYF